VKTIFQQFGNHLANTLTTHQPGDYIVLEGYKPSRNTTQFVSITNTNPNHYLLGIPHEQNTPLSTDQELALLALGYTTNNTVFMKQTSGVIQTTQHILWVLQQAIQVPNMLYVTIGDTGDSENALLGANSLYCWLDQAWNSVLAKQNTLETKPPRE
jgi:hypothetical protein